MSKPDASFPEILWPASPGPIEVGDGEVHIWACPLSGYAPSFWALLSSEEQERAGRFRFDYLRQRYVTGRASLRIILGRYLKIDPAEIAFRLGPRGKPYLNGDAGQSGLFFNLAHSQALAIVGVTRAAEIGVDVEFVQGIRDIERIAARFFAPGENKCFLQVMPAEREAAFFNAWTRKEAFLKALGEGLYYSLDRFEVTLTPGEEARLLTIDGSSEQAARWSLHAFSPAAGYVGALALPTRPARIDYRQFDAAAIADWNNCSV